MCFTTVITAMSAQAVLLALPSIGIELEIPDVSLQWLQSAYALTFVRCQSFYSLFPFSFLLFIATSFPADLPPPPATTCPSCSSSKQGCALLLAGRLADVHGRKLLYMLGLVWFAIWTLACGFMKSEIGIDIARGFSGFGAAASVPSAIGEPSPSSLRPHYQSRMTKFKRLMSENRGPEHHRHHRGELPTRTIQNTLFRSVWRRCSYRRFLRYDHGWSRHRVYLMATSVLHYRRGSGITPHRNILLGAEFETK